MRGDFNSFCRKTKTKKLELDESPYWIEQVEKERYSSELIEMKPVVEEPGLMFFENYDLILFLIFS